MSLNKLALAVLCLSLAASCASGAPVSCPPSLPSGATQHALNNASLFDGPPAEMADLVPDESGAMDKWDLDAVDPYLVCRYAGTAQIITFHATGAKDCEAGGTPFHAFCQ